MHDPKAVRSYNGSATVSGTPNVTHFRLTGLESGIWHQEPSEYKRSNCGQDGHHASRCCEGDVNGRRPRLPSGPQLKQMRCNQSACLYGGCIYTHSISNWFYQLWCRVHLFNDKNNKLKTTHVGFRHGLWNLKHHVMLSRTSAFVTFSLERDSEVEIGTKPKDWVRAHGDVRVGTGPGGQNYYWIFKMYCMSHVSVLIDFIKNYELEEFWTTFVDGKGRITKRGEASGLSHAPRLDISNEMSWSQTSCKCCQSCIT